MHSKAIGVERLESFPQLNCHENIFLKSHSASHFDSNSNAPVLSRPSKKAIDTSILRMVYFMRIIPGHATLAATRQRRNQLKFYPEFPEVQ
jgi:hypothetical protein